jgi:hypothetical protein
MNMKRMIGPVRTALVLACLWGGSVAFAQGTQGAAQPAPAAQAAPAEQKIYKNEQLDQMLAPVALYPDSLLSQLLMAATYPSDFAEAADWVKAHQDVKGGDDAVKQVESKDWDPSVKSLVAFPQVLAQFGPQADWVQKLGDAFLAQPDDVMASVQRLRAQAQKAGTLKTTEQQKVIVQQAPAEAAAPSTTVIQIEPANPQVVYVPSYNPSVVYGSWAYPSYPPYYYPPPPYYYHPVASGLAAGLAFGVGVAAINSCWGGFNWGRGDVNVNVNRYNNVNVNNRISGNGNTNWNHNSANRRGTPYADNRSRQQYGQGVGGANNRSGYRGNTGGDANRQRAQQSFNKSTGFQGGAGANAANRGSAGANAANRGGAGANAANRGGAGASAANRSGGGASNRVNASPNGAGGGGANRSSGSQSNAFSGANSRQSSQSQASRGQSSQRSSASHSGGGRSGGGGHQVSRSSPRSGGGGGGRRR